VKELIKFLAKLILFSALLFAGRDRLLAGSQFLLLGSCSLLGMRITPEMLPYDSSDKLVPLIALVLASPCLRIKKRCAVIGLGFAVFFLMDLVSIVLWVSPLSTFRGSLLPQIHLIYSNFWNLSGRWILPLIIWIIASKEEIGVFLRESPPHLP